VKITQLSRIPPTSVEAVPQPVIAGFEDFPENHNGTFSLLQLAIRKVAVYHVDSDTDIAHTDDLALKVHSTHISTLLYLARSPLT
jgi:hypothetical protein